MRSTALLLVLLVLGLALGTVLFLRDPSSKEAARAPTASEAQAEEALAPMPEAPPELPQDPETMEGKGAVDSRRPVGATENEVKAWVIEGSARFGLLGPYPKAHVLAKLYDGMHAVGASREEQLLTCDEQGRFRWPLVAPAGPVTVTVSAAPLAEGEELTRTSIPDSANVPLGGGPPVDLEVHFYPTDSHIKGVVTDEKGQPIAGAKVRGTVQTVMTNDLGHFDLLSSSAHRQEFLYAEADGFAQARATAMIDGVSSGVSVNFELLPALQIKGRVQDEEGRPIQGAQVTAFFTNKNIAISASDGTFLLDHLNPQLEHHSMSARKEGFVEAAVQLSSEELRTDEPILVLKRGARVEGIVIGSDGAPVEGADLYIGFSPNAFNRLDAVSSNDGFFVFPNVGEGSQTLVAQYPGLAPVTRQLLIQPDAKALPTLTIRLEKGHFLGGVVSDTETKPLEGIGITARHKGEYINVRTETDSEGHFRIEGLPAGDVELGFYNSDFVRKKVPIASLDRDDLEITLVWKGQVGGRVIDGETGDPIDVFLVRFVDPVLSAGEERAYGYSATWAREGQAFSGTDGYWDSGTETLEPGKILGVEIRSDGYAPLTRASVTVEAGLNPDDHLYPMLRGGRVFGRVLDSDNAPVGGCELALRSREAGIGLFYETRHLAGVTHTDEQGYFAIENAAPGEGVLRVAPPGRTVFQDGPFDVPVGGDLERVIILPKGASISGHVLTEDGSPDAGRTVAILASDVPGNIGFLTEVESGEDGSFAVDGLVAGLYQVSRVLQGAGQRMFDLSIVRRLVDGSVTEVTLRDRGNGTIRGRVELEDGRTFLPATQVSASFRLDAFGNAPDPASPETQPPSRGAIVEQGEFEITGLEPGTYSLFVVHHDNGARLVGSVDVSVKAGESEEVVLVLSVSNR